MLLPLIGWVVTGVVFLTKPGYKAAFEQIAVKQYPIENLPQIAPQKNWLEIRRFKTVLGNHLLVNIAGVWTHLDPDTLEVRNPPSNQNFIALITDATSFHPQRYGTRFTTKNENTVISDTGIELSIDWNNLRIRQQGADTHFINTLYKIHYLQWTWNSTANKVFPIAGLSALFLLVLFGLIAYLKPTRRSL